VVGTGTNCREAYDDAKAAAERDGVDVSMWMPFVRPGCTDLIPNDGESVVFAAWLHLV
jgi:hypothetical protein